MVRKGRFVVSAAVLAVMVVVGSNFASAAQATSSPARLVTIAIPDAHGEIPAKWLPYPGPPRANILLPAGYDPHKRYPLAVLLHGFDCNYDWYRLAGLTQDFEQLGAIVVMPEGGSGWYTDWFNGGERANPAWESYVLDEVIPTVLSRYRVLPQRRYHALVGISMGGLGAAYLGGRLPGFFGSVASLSGFVDPGMLAPVTDAVMGVLSEAFSRSPFHGDVRLNPVYGPSGGSYFIGHNPTRLVANLQQTRVFLSTGNGVPSDVGLAGAAHDAGIGVTLASAEEGPIIYPMNQVYHRALVAAGVDVTYQVHRGGHDIPDFEREVKALLAWGLFRPVVTDPKSWVNYTVATNGQLWDIHYRFDRPPNTVVRFRRLGDTLTIGAAGSPVTITRGGCTIHTATPAVIGAPTGACT